MSQLTVQTISNAPSVTATKSVTGPNAEHESIWDTEGLKEKTALPTSSKHGKWEHRKNDNESLSFNFTEDLCLRYGYTYGMGKIESKTTETDKANKLRYITYTDVNGNKNVQTEKLGFLGIFNTRASSQFYDEKGHLVREEVRNDDGSTRLTNYGCDGKKISEAIYRHAEYSFNDCKVRLFLEDESYVQMDLAVKHIDLSTEYSTFTKYEDYEPVMGVYDKDGNKVEDGKMTEEQKAMMESAYSKFKDSY